MKEILRGGQETIEGIGTFEEYEDRLREEQEENRNNNEVCLFKNFENLLHL